MPSCETVGTGRSTQGVTQSNQLHLHIFAYDQIFLAVHLEGAPLEQYLV